MDLGIISTRYARALLKGAKGTELETQVYHEMMTLAKSYADVPALRQAIGNLDAQRGHLTADVGDGGLFLLFDGDFRIVQESGTLCPSLLLRLFHDGVARLGSLSENLSLLFASLLQDGFTFFLDIGEPLPCLVGLAKRFVNEVLTLLHHSSDDGEAELGKKEKDHQKRDEHPEE